MTNYYLPTYLPTNQHTYPLTYLPLPTYLSRIRLIKVLLTIQSTKNKQTNGI